VGVAVSQWVQQLSCQTSVGLAASQLVQQSSRQVCGRGPTDRQVAQCTAATTQAYRTTQPRQLQLLTSAIYHIYQSLPPPPPPAQPADLFPWQWRQSAPRPPTLAGGAALR
jgi:hypothetical protein